MIGFNPGVVAFDPQEMVACLLAAPTDARPSESHLIFDENGYGPDELARFAVGRVGGPAERSSDPAPEARRPWVMRHSSQPRYGKLECPNPYLAGSGSMVCWPPRLVSAKRRLSLG